MTINKLRKYWRYHRCCYYDGKFCSYGRLIQIVPTEKANEALLEENWTFEEWLDISKKKGYLCRQYIDSPFSEPIEWDGVIEPYSSSSDNKYGLRHCRYEGKTLTYYGLVRRLKKDGVKDYLSKAKECLIPIEEEKYA